MHPLLLRTRARVRDAAKWLGEAAVGALTITLLRTTRYFDPVKTANLFARVTRRIGPLLREQRIGRANLKAAFPEKSPEEIETILAGVWDNLGRLGAEFAHIDHIWDYDPACPAKSRIEIAPRTHELFAQLQERRETRTDLRKPSRQLGISGAGRSRAWGGFRGAVPAAQQCRRRPHHQRNAPGQHGHTDPGRPRRAVSARRSAAARASMSACWSINI